MTPFKEEKKKIDAEILAEFKKRSGQITVIFAEVSALMRSRGYKCSPSRVQQVVYFAKYTGKL